MSKNVKEGLEKQIEGMMRMMREMEHRDEELRAVVGERERIIQEKE